MALAIVQHKSAVLGSAIPGAVTLAGAPTAGNRIVAMIGVNTSEAALTVNTGGGWSTFTKAVQETESTQGMIGLWRDVGVGESATLPAFCTAGSTYSAYVVWEISGVGPSWDDDAIGLFAVFDKTAAVHLPDMVAPASGILALTAVARYNGNSDPSITSGWTLDEAAHNSGNFGSVAGAHQAFADGDAIGGTWTVTTTDVGGAILLLLGTTLPTRPFIRRGRSLSGTSRPDAVKLFGLPKLGSLILASIAWGNGGSGAPTLNTGNWTNFVTALAGSNPQALGNWRYVAGGDTDVLPQLYSAGSAFFFCSVIEVTGVSGVFADDVVAFAAARQASGSSMTTTPVNTTAADQLGVIMASNYDGSAFLSFSAGWNQALASLDFSNYGAVGIAAKNFPVAGTAVTGTITETGTGNPAAWIQVVIGGGSGGDSSGSEGSEASSGDATPGRITQGARLAVAQGTADARTTQGVRLAVGNIEPPVRLTQGVRLVVAAGRYPARITQAVRMIVADAVPCATQWQQLWRIKRRDGRVFRYTSLDVDFPWGDGLYKACGSMLPSAAEDNIAVGSVSNQELQGIFKDDGITEAEIYGGLFDDAFVEVWLVPYVGAEAPRRLAAGWTGNMSHGEGGFTMEVVGPGARLDQQAMVQLYGPGCRWVFGSPQCGFDREAVKIDGAVVVAFNRGKFIADFGGASSGGASSGEDEGLQWANGLVRWTSGRNIGLECEVKTVDFASGEVELWELAGFEPDPADTFDMLPGCDLSFPTCKDVYANGINFGGFKDVPGQDSVVSTPDAKIT